MRRRGEAPAPLSTRESAALGALAVALGAVFVGLAALARFWPTGGWETMLVIDLALHEQPGAELVRLLNRVGNLDAWLIVVACVSAAVWFARGVRAALLVATSFVVDAVNFLFKLLVERARPELDPSQVFGLDDFGFPSGHTARTAALAGALVIVLAPARWRVAAALAAAALFGLVMGYARIALGVHFPLDTLGGLCLGVTWFAATTLLLVRRRDATSRIGDPDSVRNVP